MIKIFDSPTELATEVAKILLAKSKEKKTLTVALSGGNTPKLLFSILAKNYKTSINWKNIKFFWVDERCVPPTHPESNYGEANSLLFNNIDIPKENIYRIRGENNPREEALAYEEILYSQIERDCCLPKFDIIFLGMGDDGHTASIFPYQIDLLKSDKVCEVATHPTSGQQRITLTGNIINNASEIYFWITGKNKAQILADIFNKQNDYLKYPTAHINSDKASLTWLLDKDAASLL